MALTITDPTYTPRAHDGLLERTALRFINDPRDLPFIWTLLAETVTVLPVGIYLLVPGTFNPWLALAYLVFTYAVMMPPFILMMHNAAHRKLFKKQYAIMNEYIPWVIGPFFGETPWTYFVHHIGMHHPENNLPDDLSSTMPYQRDSFVGFLHYYLRMVLFGLVELSLYEYRHKRLQLMRMCLVGELTFYAVTAAMLYVNWRGAMVVLVFPVLLTRFLMMAGNWGQHAFVDAAAPANCYRNSITCINSPYNRRCWNDGYHISHHWKATRHWTEHPQELLDNEETYARESAIVFEVLDFNGVWFCLMLKRYDWLAKRFVRLAGDTRSDEEIIAMMKERTRRIPEASAQVALAT